ncbi:bifunctional 2-polyprenyl-6-hydroxyphenol methylase/3-demethylubiquinol 3-O-methyltransferase UbiG [Flavobacterium sp. IB48]|uniref:class I SAM-dependent methyltransferase n=1 Tax=Flavobacterium sp. IB48 TaxID=2779375 RepID=UPI0018E89ADD|nr:class I SAM-dependent methyltransferase [Flavobacterium sp. IB48]MBJ2126431.1 class I SAM-dependent methyltransferase [Flavobacterium sp. IB48]
MKNCILCESKKISIYQNVNFKLLKKIYENSLNIDISKGLESDADIKFYHCENCSLDFFEPKFAGNAFFYEELQLKRKVYYSPDRKEFESASEFIKENESVLEIGSGSGFFAQKIKNNNYVGLEFNDEAIKKAREKGIELIKQNIEDYAKSTTKKFDVVCSFHVLEHVKNPREFLEACMSKLNSKGKLIIAVPCNDSALTSNHNHILNLPPHHITRWKISSLTKLIDLFDLKLIDYKVIPISENITTSQYLKAVMLKKVVNIIYPQNKIVIDPDRLNKVKKWTDFIVSKLRLHKKYNQKKIIGENVIFVFEKK